MSVSDGKYDRATLLAVVQIIFGMVIFSSAWWLSADQAKGSALYIFGFMTVLLGIATGIFLSSRRP